MAEPVEESNDSGSTRAEAECACRMIADFRFYLTHINAMNVKEKLAVLYVFFSKFVYRFLFQKLFGRG